MACRARLPRDARAGRKSGKDEASDAGEKDEEEAAPKPSAAAKEEAAKGPHALAGIIESITMIDFLCHKAGRRSRCALRAADAGGARRSCDAHLASAAG